MATRHRKNRSNRHRKNRINRHRMPIMMGGMAPVGDTSMAMSQHDSLKQGAQFANMHKAQHGGYAPYPASMGATLPSSMVASARTGPLDAAIASIQGMQDGGRRRRRSSRNRSSRKNRNRSSRSTRNRRRHRGGAFTGAPLSDSSMLLPPGLEKQAALNYEWSMAKDPSAFLPKQ